MLLSFPLFASTVQLNIGEAAETAELSGAGSTFGEFVSSMLQATMAIAAIILLVYLVWAGIDWITAGGDSGKIEKARQKITQSIIGIIVLASTVALFSLVQSFLGIDVFKIKGGKSFSATPGSSSRNALDEAREAVQDQSQLDRMRDAAGRTTNDSGSAADN